MPRPKKSIQMLEAEKKLEAIEAGLAAPKVADQKPIDFQGEVSRSIAKLGTPRIPAVVVSEELFDVNLANGVKVGNKQLTYIHSDQYSLDLHKGRLAIRLRIWPAKEKTVYTTINNIMYWR